MGKTAEQTTSMQYHHMSNDLSVITHIIVITHIFAFPHINWVKKTTTIVQQTHNKQVVTFLFPPYNSDLMLKVTFL